MTQYIFVYLVTLVGLAVLTVAAQTIVGYIALAVGSRREEEHQDEEPPHATPTPTTRESSTPTPSVTSDSHTVAYGPSEKSPAVATEATPLRGLSFAITGKLAVKREWVASLIRRYGGEVHSRLRHDTRYLVQGDTGIRYTDKENRARQYGTEVIYESDLCTMIGIRFDEFVSNPTAYAYASSEEQQRHECRTAHSREARSIARATADLRTSLQLMADSSTITFAQPVRVMVADSDEMARCTSLQMHRTASHSKEYTLTTTDGDTVYLDDVYTGCIADLYQAAVA